MGVSAPSLHREFTDSIVCEKLILPFSKDIFEIYLAFDASNILEPDSKALHIAIACVSTATTFTDDLWQGSIPFKFY